MFVWKILLRELFYPGVHSLNKGRFGEASRRRFFIIIFKLSAYVNHRRTLQDLKANMRVENANILAAVLVLVRWNTRNRLIQCIGKGGITTTWNDFQQF